MEEPVGTASLAPAVPDALWFSVSHKWQETFSVLQRERPRHPPEAEGATKPVLGKEGGTGGSTWAGPQISHIPRTSRVTSLNLSLLPVK